MSNRRAFHYSYNLINNNEEAGKDYAKKPGGTAGYDVHGFTRYDSNLSPRKLSLPTTKTSTTLPIRKNSTHEYRGDSKDNSHVTKERKTSRNGHHSELFRAQKNGVHELDKAVSTRPTMGARYSDPLYEQRTLPPLPFNKPRGGSDGSLYSSMDNLTNQKRIIQMSSKSQSMNYATPTYSNFNRKEGVSAIGNYEYMHGKMRKKGVVDSTDEAHYQRQFLRVLNKRF